MREKLTQLIMNAPKLEFPSGSRAQGKTYQTASNIADHLLANGVIVLPCKVGTTVYEIEPLWYSIWGEDDHECRKCEHFYEGGMGDHPDCSLGKNCCYQIIEKEADLRSLADWIIPSMFTKVIAWGKTVFLTREEAENALVKMKGGAE